MPNKVTGTEMAYRRKDSVYVVPIGCLKKLASKLTAGFLGLLMQVL